MRKKIVPCIYLKNRMAVKSFNDDSIIETDPVRLAKIYSDALCDEILVFDLSNVDNEHEAAIDTIKDIASAVKVPVIGAGNVKRMEDVKKLIYAGCKKAVLNYSREDNIALTGEVAGKFGKEKLVACIKHKDEYEDNKELIKNGIGEVLLLEENIKDESSIKEFDGNIILMVPEVSLDKLIGLFSFTDNVSVTGEVINQNAEQYESIRKLIGIEVLPFSKLKTNSDGLIPVVVQDYKTGAVLMLAYMNEEAYDMTLRTRTMTYWSRSRNELWVKGETSGHYQYVKSLSYDCDADTLLAKVEQIGNACHTGAYSCFFNDIITYDYEEKNPFSVLSDVYEVIEDRKANPKEGSYTNYLFDKGIDKILKKVGEEATEIVIAAKNPNANEIKYEISDFLYHVMVLMVERGVTWEEIMRELANR
ncbi:MAG: bifunctional phosphoribosyl-AMP cyclohydrolase/phosphoribosyl-ATP diphosphatase HisIE [Lachnospiraceae bacterium]|nr:bifunctional phosphoribosyl-AMP cyclohydrolase/phosphoribosyl-ATP diphosphatase HisIE [Lachnospiraceae bacterium]